MSFMALEGAFQRLKNDSDDVIRVNIFALQTGAVGMEKIGHFRGRESTMKD